MNLKLHDFVQRDPEIISAEAGEEVVMVSIQNGFYYGVAGVAREIWSEVENPKKVSDLVEVLSHKYNIDRSSCELETLKFLEDLLAERLLQVKDGTAS